MFKLERGRKASSTWRRSRRRCRPGFVGKIPSVTQCTDAQAAATQESGAGCPASSQVGTVKVAAGSGSPFTLLGDGLSD